jgi:hypothetical protein
MGDADLRRDACHEVRLHCIRYSWRHSALKLEGKDQERIHQLLKAYYRSIGEGAAVVFTQACIIVYARKLRGAPHRV